MSNASFKPSLGLMDATMIVAGSMIGSGIFIVSADITRNVGSAGWLILVWLITGFMTLIAALSYGELSSMFPKAGGQYVYLKEAYNPVIGFLYGWSFFAVIQTGTIAAVGVAFSKFLAYLVPELGNNYFLFDTGFIKIYSGQLVAIAIIVLLTYVNSRGVKEGKFIQTVFTTANASVQQLAQQRKRWVSKSTKYDNRYITAILVGAYLFNASVLILLIVNPIAGLCVLAGKTLVEALFLFDVMRFFKHKSYLLFLPLAELFHIIYVLIIGIWANVGTYTWKERDLK